MKKLLFLFAVTTAIAICAFTVYKPGGYALCTGSPRDNGQTCAGCHSGGATVPTLSVYASPAFGPGNTYLPSTTYTVNVACSGSYPKYGFDLEILNGTTASATTAGTFGAAVTTNCWKYPNTTIPVNMTHTAPTGTGNAATFSFKWTSPSAGNAYLYCAALGVNNTGGTGGDRTTTAGMVLIPQTVGMAAVENDIREVRVFPNPAHETLNLSYIVEEEGTVKVELFDLQGKEAMRLISEEQDPGRHGFSYTLPAGLPKGMYFLKVETGTHHAVEKVLVS